MVWVGYDEQASLREYASKLALPIWVDYMKRTLDKSQSMVERPADVMSILINRKTGLLADSDDSDTMFELFTTDSQPKQDDRTKKAVRSAEIREELF